MARRHVTEWVSCSPYLARVKADLPYTPWAPNSSRAFHLSVTLPLPTTSAVEAKSAFATALRCPIDCVISNWPLDKVLKETSASKRTHGQRTRSNRSQSACSMRRTHQRSISSLVSKPRCHNPLPRRSTLDRINRIRGWDVLSCPSH